MRKSSQSSPVCARTIPQSRRSVVSGNKKLREKTKVKSEFSWRMKMGCMFFFQSIFSNKLYSSLFAIPDWAQSNIQIFNLKSDQFQNQEPGHCWRQWKGHCWGWG